MSDTPPTHHAKYYFEDGNIIFLVESSLFRVHRYFFIRDSPLFAAMLSLPVPPGAEAEGSTDTNPIELPQVKTIDFERLLWVFYSPSYMTGKASVPAWFSILHLADKWEMETIRMMAIHTLKKTNLTSVENLSLGLQAHDEDWVLKAYMEFCTRPHPLRDWEAQGIIQIRDLSVVCEIAAIREERRINKHYVQEQVLCRIMHPVTLPAEELPQAASMTSDTELN